MLSTPKDALGDNLEGMRDLGKLDLRWSNDSYGSLDERVLHQLKPNMNVRCLVIAGYGGSRFPAWLIDQFLVDLEAYISFKSLESLPFERMPQWCEWIPNVAESEEKAFPRLQVLCIREGKLPNSIGSLKQPWYMNLSESSEHRFSETVCTLHNLRIPILRWCKNLVELPTNLMNLTNLYHLDIKGARLQQMTPQMGKLSKPSNFD
ncbi:hypothetical protein POTOM_054324 [Populus tomentosa]|uniref:R13L1/DRL21-like LRR repeat region domain-containing protein n=1 Tax=Populus tomentosa TaxID=118781 RepID=A0A8X7XZI9_POPTO|nr:hypothetical protein POTOM_054320 [Populus tomentosa]KAG6743367.1 hypothetical protein POTOM_054321 [Populus tomentosa]KAG6743368.1 hypothetical protein POTOM_054322 [Populus tomentosa]KAG6743369.1 hypothetical protein POTOM_054323 [Populus tomentosa]KAG6743370.1 hypothetical protein POTOM_054324 [Populus tomentosa]